MCNFTRKQAKDNVHFDLCSFPQPLAQNLVSFARTLQEDKSEQSNYCVVSFNIINPCVVYAHIFSEKENCMLSNLKNATIID